MAYSQKSYESASSRHQETSFKDVVAQGENLSEFISAAGITAGSIWAGRKVFGPSLDTVGKNFAELVDWRKKNANKIADHAERISKANGTPDDAYVHPRIAERFVNDLSWIDDELMQRYSAGLLAAARSEGGEDDRALRYLNIVSDMTKAETLLHFLIYRSYYDHFRTIGGLNGKDTFWAYQLRLPVSPLLAQLYPGHTDVIVAFHNFREALAGLVQHGLLAELTTHVEAPPEAVDAQGHAPIISFQLKINGDNVGSTMFMQVRGVSDSNPNAIATRVLPPFGEDEPVPVGAAFEVTMS